MREEKAIIVHPTRFIKYNEDHEKAKRETPRIPLDVLPLVAGHLDDARSVIQFALVSKLCHQFTEDDGLWRNLYLKKGFPVSSHAPTGRWKSLYKFQTKFIKEVLLNKNLDEILERAYPRWENVGSISLPVEAVRNWLDIFITWTTTTTS